MYPCLIFSKKNVVLLYCTHACVRVNTFQVSLISLFFIDPDKLNQSGRFSHTPKQAGPRLTQNLRLAQNLVKPKKIADKQTLKNHGPLKSDHRASLVISLGLISQSQPIVPIHLFILTNPSLSLSLLFLISFCKQNDTVLDSHIKVQKTLTIQFSSSLHQIVQLRSLSSLFAAIQIPVLRFNQSNFKSVIELF